MSHVRMEDSLELTVSFQLIEQKSMIQCKKNTFIFCGELTNGNPQQLKPLSFFFIERIDAVASTHHTLMHITNQKFKIIKRPHVFAKCIAPFSWAVRKISTSDPSVCKKTTAQKTPPRTIQRRNRCMLRQDLSGDCKHVGRGQSRNRPKIFGKTVNGGPLSHRYKYGSYNNRAPLIGRT